MDVSFSRKMLKQEINSTNGLWVWYGNSKRKYHYRQWMLWEGSPFFNYFFPFPLYLIPHCHMDLQTCGQLLSISVMLMYLRRVTCTATGSLPKKSSYAGRPSTLDTAGTTKVNPQISPSLQPSGLLGWCSCNRSILHILWKALSLIASWTAASSAVWWMKSLFEGSHCGGKCPYSFCK